MEYKLCNDNTICCDSDCRKCANLVHDALTNENKNLKTRCDKLTEKCDHQVEAHNKLYDAYWDVKGERDRIYDELKELKSKKMVPLSEVYRIIAGHSNYHGNSILSALTCIAEGKEVGPVATYEYIWIKEKEFKELVDKCQGLEKQLEWANENIESLNNKCFDDGVQIMSKDRKIMELEEDNSKLLIANARLHTERVSYDYLSSLYKELEEKCAKLEKENNPLLARFSGIMVNAYSWTEPNAYGELCGKIEGLKEDIIRLDKCLSKRQCVQLERIKEERDGE